MAHLADIVFITGLAVGSALLAVLVATLLVPRLRLWPTPGPRSWQSYVFWPLFRGLNVLCFLAAVADRASGLALPLWLRITAAAVLAGSTAAFVYAFWVLGRENSYGASQGLVTAGVYQWTRNPQNTMLVVVYACLALAADSARVYLLCGAMIVAYVLMVLAEEPWLEGIYGDAYRRYCAEVPRFFNWRLLLGAAAARRRG